MFSYFTDESTLKAPLTPPPVVYQKEIKVFMSIFRLPFYISFMMFWWIRIIHTHNFSVPVLIIGCVGRDRRERLQTSWKLQHFRSKLVKCCHCWWSRLGDAKRGREERINFLYLLIVHVRHHSPRLRQPQFMSIYIQRRQFRICWACGMRVIWCRRQTGFNKSLPCVFSLYSNED